MKKEFLEPNVQILNFNEDIVLDGSNTDIIKDPEDGGFFPSFDNPSK